MVDVTYTSLHLCQLRNYKLDGYAWLAVVEIDDRKVRDQRKIIFPVLDLFILFFFFFKLSFLVFPLFSSFPK